MTQKAPASPNIAGPGRQLCTSRFEPCGNSKMVRKQITTASRQTTKLHFQERMGGVGPIALLTNTWWISSLPTVKPHANNDKVSVSSDER